MGKSIGIDLGTTNSSAAIRRVHTEILKNAEGDDITPSCVTVRKKKLPFSKPEFVVGKNALEWMKQDPENTIVAIKRLMGRNFQDKIVQDIMTDHRLHYKIQQHSKGTENSLAVILGGREYTPEDISARILEKLRKDSETVLQDKVEYAVITVPAYFNDKQKHATRTAAALAGIKVRRLLPEPTSAAISFGVDMVKGDEAKTVLVFDFGGGTLDLSVLTISGGQFIEQGKGGDMWLGGEDIDRIIADHILVETSEEYSIENIVGFIESQDIKIKNRFIGELRSKVEQAKVQLSTEDSANIEILGLLKDADGDAVDVDVELSREQFEKLIAPMVERMVQLTRSILKSIHFTPDLIDNVLMVGGSSQIPSVIFAMKKEFGDEKVLIHERPMLAIAEGAAILSHRLSDVYECPQCGWTVKQDDATCKKCKFDLKSHVIAHGVFDIIHAAAHDYYIYLENDEKYLMIEKNTPLPCEKTEVFKLVHKEQRLVHMRFFNIVNEVEESIGDLWLGIDTKYPENPYSIEVTLKIDENNIVEVAAKIKEEPEIKLSKTLSRGKADEKLFVALEETINEANAKKYTEYVLVDLTFRSISAIRDIDRIVNPETNEINETLFNRAEIKINKARKLAAEKRSSHATISYAKVAIEDFGPALPSSVKKIIQKKVERLEEMDERGTYEENIKALDDLNESLNKELGPVNALMEIQKAGDFCMETDPSKASKFYRSIQDILKSFQDANTDKAMAMLKEILPEAYDIVNQYESKSGVIYKDIKR